MLWGSPRRKAAAPAGGALRAAPVYVRAPVALKLQGLRFGGAGGAAKARGQWGDRGGSPHVPLAGNNPQLRGLPRC